MPLAQSPAHTVIPASPIPWPPYHHSLPKLSAFPSSHPPHHPSQAASPVTQPHCHPSLPHTLASLPSSQHYCRPSQAAGVVTHRSCQSCFPPPRGYTGTGTASPKVRLTLVFPRILLLRQIRFVTLWTITEKNRSFSLKWSVNLSHLLTPHPWKHWLLFLRRERWSLNSGGEILTLIQWLEPPVSLPSCFEPVLGNWSERLPKSIFVVN